MWGVCVVTICLTEGSEGRVKAPCVTAPGWPEAEFRFGLKSRLRVESETWKELVYCSHLTPSGSDASQ